MFPTSQVTLSLCDLTNENNMLTSVILAEGKDNVAADTHITGDLFRSVIR